MLSALRAEVRADLETEFEHAYDYTANEPKMPCAIVVPGQPYLEKRRATDEDPPAFDEIGDYNAVLDVLLLAARDVNKANAALMDGLIEQGLLALKDRDVRRVSQPAVVTISGIKYLGAFITISETWEAP